MAEIKWGTPESIQSILTTELNALGNGALSAVSGAIDNETDKYQFIALELILNTLTPTTGAYMTVYMVPQIDGTNFADNNVSIAEILATFPLSISAGAKRTIRANIAIPPLQFKLSLENKANVTLNATNNILKFRRYNAETV